MKLTTAHFEALACNRDRVMMALAAHANGRGECSISQRQLADATGLSCSAVGAILRRLEACGAISRSESDRDGEAGSQPHRITIHRP